jgi:hypothetical protein
MGGGLSATPLYILQMDKRKQILSLLFIVPIFLSGQIDSLHTVGGWKIIEHTGSVIKARSRVVTDTAYSGKHSQSYIIQSVDTSDLSSVTWEKIYSKTFTKTKQGIVFLYLKKLGSSFPDGSYILVIFYFGNSSGYVKNMFVPLYVPAWVHGSFSPITFDLGQFPEKFDRIKIKIRLRYTNDVEVFLDCLAFDYGDPMIDDFEDTTVPVKDEQTIIDSFTLFQNYPNPFNPITVIRFHVSSQIDVKLKVYDLLGKEVETLVNEMKYPGEYSIQFNGSNLPSGIYFYQLIAGNFISTKKMQFIK